MAAYQPPPDQLGEYLECLDSAIFLLPRGFLLQFICIDVILLIVYPKISCRDITLQ